MVTAIIDILYQLAKKKYVVYE